MRRLATLALAVLLPAAFAMRARGDEPSRETWRFRKGDHVRTVEVTGLPETVREALVRRLAADGYERVEDAGDAEAPGRDLRADAEALVRHGGRFPRGAVPSPRFLGARLAWAPGEGGARIAGADPGSLAAALGLEPGDRLLAVDGREATPEAVRERVGAELVPGQLTLRILRREGRTESLGLEFRRGLAPRGARRASPDR